MNKHSFHDKSVWITGASSGIGEALAYAFNELGAHLILSARNVKNLERVRGNCPNPNSRVGILPFDLADLSLLPGVVATALEHSGRIDFMIHNAGVALRDTVINTELPVDQKLMTVNYLAPVAITKLLLPRMIENGGGHFVVISSLSGKFGVPKLSAYSASKHALHGFFDSLRSEIIDQNIRITILIPGIVNTHITVNALKGDGSLNLKMEQLQAQGMSPEKCARKMLKAIGKEREEALVGGSEIYTVYFHRLFPTLFSRVIRNHPIKRINKWRKRILGR